MKTTGAAFSAGILAVALFSLAVTGFSHHMDALQSRLDASDAELRRSRDEVERVREEHRQNVRELEMSVSDTRTGVDTLEARLASRTADVDGLYRDVLFPSVQVNGRGGVGGGTILHSRPGHTYVVSAYHVLQKTGGKTEEPLAATEVRIYDSRGAVRETVTADLVAFDEKKDLALLRLQSARSYENVARLASRETLRQVTVFTPIYAVGCPLGHDPLPTLGEVATLHKEVNGERFWMMNAPTIFGNSGGGIFHRETHEMIGVSVMVCTYDGVVATPVPHLGVLVSLETVYDWLDSLDYEFVYESTAAVPVRTSSPR